MTNNDAAPFDEASLPEDSSDDLFDVDVDVDVAPQYGYWGFTVRELLMVGVWAVAFVVSFFPLGAGGASVWTTGLHWLLTIGVPTVALFLIVLRRFSPEGIRRVGSLGIDQFASVAFSVSAMLWVQHVWDSVSFALRLDGRVLGWVMWVELTCMLALVVLTVVAPLIPGLREDFEGRMETLAHRNANPIRPVIAYPTVSSAQVAPAGSAVVEGDDGAGEGDGVTADADTDAHESAVASDEAYTDVIVPLGDATAHDVSEIELTDDTERVEETQADVAPVEAGQPFWALAPETRPVHDEQGDVLFEIGPEAWILVIEDRGGAYVVRHDDGRVGYLHDTTDMTRG
ncbi:hypothetical protein ACWIBQ_02910 [Microbacterium keratanolyticum]